MRDRRALRRSPIAVRVSRPIDKETASHKECHDQFDDRERAFEAKFARDEEMQFRIIARRNRLLGQWAARRWA